MSLSVSLKAPSWSALPRADQVQSTAAYRTSRQGHPPSSRPFFSSSLALSTSPFRLKPALTYQSIYQSLNRTGSFGGPFRAPTSRSGYAVGCLHLSNQAVCPVSTPWVYSALCEILEHLDSLHRLARSDKSNCQAPRLISISHKEPSQFQQRITRHRRFR